MSVDQRRHERVTFFLVPVEREQLPVWVFKPEQLIGSHAGLILDMSASGTRVLTAGDSAPPPGRYTLHLLLDGDADAPRFSSPVRQVWSQPMGKLGTLNGFEFEDPQAPAREFLRTYVPSIDDRTWVRCALALEAVTA